MRVFLTGATGFVGRHLLPALLDAGHEVVALAHRAAATDPRVTWVGGRIDDVESLVRGMAGCDAVIHLVAIIREQGTATFDRVHVQGTANVIIAMERQGIARLLHMSALGTGPEAATGYFRTKWQSEEMVRGSALTATIFRPSLIFGPGDGIISMLAEQFRTLPVIPIIGSGNYAFDLISVHAVAAAFVQALAREETQGQTVELCGPQRLTYRHILAMLSAHMHIRKPWVHLPPGLVATAVRVGHALMLPMPITPDQLTMLLQGNVCPNTDAQALFDLPQITLEEGMREYL